VLGAPFGGFCYEVYAAAILKAQLRKILVCMEYFGKQYTTLLQLLNVKSIATNIENILFHSKFPFSHKPLSGKKQLLFIYLLLVKVCFSVHFCFCVLDCTLV